MVRTVRGSMEMQTSIFTPHTLNDAAEALRPVVRAFLERELAHLPMADRTQTWANGDRYDGDFLNDKRHGHGVY